MSMFDVGDEIERGRAAAISDRDRAGAWAAVAHQRLPEAVREAGWRLLHRGDRFDPAANAEALVIGVAPWSEADLLALGELHGRITPGNTAVWIFDIDDCENSEDIAHFLPGVRPPTQTPVVAEYTAGGVTRTAEGSEALELIAGFDR